MLVPLSEEVVVVDVTKRIVTGVRWLARKPLFGFLITLADVLRLPKAVHHSLHRAKVFRVVCSFVLLTPLEPLYSR